MQYENQEQKSHMHLRHQFKIGCESKPDGEMEKVDESFLRKIVSKKRTKWEKKRDNALENSRKWCVCIQ